VSSIEGAMHRKKKAEQKKGAGQSRPSDHAGASEATHRDGNEERQSPVPTTGHSREAAAGSALDGPELRIDFHRLRQAGMVPPAAMEERISNEYRRIKRPLVNNATGRGAVQVPHGNIVMLTSSVPGEGKTFTALNLALSLARDPDFSVTLVDGDTARRDLSHLLGVSQQPGLLDLLADSSLAVRDLVMPTNVDQLSVLSSGSHHELSEELFSSQRMTDLMALLGNDTPNHIILFDTPPVLAAPEAVTLSYHMGQILLVVKASSTRQDQVITALDQLDQDKAINMVLNQSLGGPGGDKYGGYYGYEYGQDR